MDRRTFTPKEAMEYLGLSKNIMYALLRSGRLKSIRVGKKYLIPAENMEAFLKSQ